MVRACKTFSIGQKVKLSEHYLGNYIGLQTYKNKIATITSVKKIPLDASKMSKNDLATYRKLYGVQKEYILFELLIKFGETSNCEYMVSQFGVDLA